MADDQLLAEWRELQREVASRVVERSSGDCSYCSSRCVRVREEGGGEAGGRTGRFEILTSWNFDAESLYGGVDVSFASAAAAGGKGSAVAVYVVLRRKKKENYKRRQQHSDILSDNYELIYSDSVRYSPSVPYMSGYLAFREIEPLLTLIRRQVEQQPECTPRIILVDGNGILHPRRAGIACFLGVRTGIPTIGIGKKLCCVEDCWTISEADSAIALGLRDAGMALTETRNIPSNGLILDTKGVSFVETDSGPDTCEDVPSIKDSAAIVLDGKFKGYATYLRSSNGTLLGAALVGHGGKAYGALRGKPTSNPIYISVGHDISLKEAIVVCEELSDVRIPEPVRTADLMGRKLIRESIAG